MSRLRVQLVQALLCLLFAMPAHAYINPPFLSPTTPHAGQSVSVSVDSGVCDAIADEPGYPQITQNGSHIQVVLLAFRFTDIELCNLPSGVSTFPIGAYAEGVYDVDVVVFYYDEHGNPQNESIGVLPMRVEAAAAAPVGAPTSTPLSLILLAALLCVIALRKQSRVVPSALALALSCGHHVRADVPEPATEATRTIEVLLSTAPGAPSPEQIVAYIQSPVGAPPLEALRNIGPQRATPMLPKRAEGTLLAMIRQNPNSPRAKLERYIVIAVADSVDVDRLLTSLAAEPYVEAAYQSRQFDPSSVTLGMFSVTTDASGGQFEQLNLHSAWGTSTGNALILSVDTGTYPSHPALQQFSGSTYVGGNFVPAVSVDYGLTGFSTPSGFSVTDVDEAKAVNNPSPSSCPTGFQQPINAGHGTHTSGLMVANVGSGQGVQGACKHCGLGIEKTSRTFCSMADNQIHLTTNSASYAPALTSAVDQGAQIVNMSWGGSETGNFDYCHIFPSDALCLAIDYAASRDVTMVASSGNDRARLNSPASDPDVVAVGGIDIAGAFWDESPGTNTNCPYWPSNSKECGSNYTTLSYLPKQEFVAEAKNVWSTTYPNKDWNTTVHCGDYFPGPTAGSGVGLCTGTSMSAPLVSGVMGILRSINPLVLKGTPSPATGLRGVLATTTYEAQSSLPWDSKMGYGTPDAAAAARKLIGTVGGRVIRNRATPLFRMYSSSYSDYADSTSPQYALSLMNSKGGWAADAGTKTVPNYYLPGESTLAKASMYVLTTQYRPRPAWPVLVPLYMMRKTYSGGSHIDHMMATTKTELQTANTAGYSLLNIQGYVYKACSPDCIPPGAQKLWRKFRSSINDCAVFLENERPNFEGAGYTAACPAGPTTLIGYAYPSGVDTDNDGLPDGFEYVVGTDPTRADSDGDGSTNRDGDELPMTGVPVSDPCSGGAYGATYCYTNDVIFTDGMEAL